MELEQAGWVVLGVALVAWLLRDVLQRKDNIKRNIPLFGTVRVVIDASGHFLRHYLYEGDQEGRPVPRLTREWIYAAAKGEKTTQPYGTRLDLDRPGAVLVRHSFYPREAEPDREPERVWVGRGLEHPYAVSRFNISAMSFGSLGRRATLALSKGAAEGGFYHNTGEGGVSPYHLEGGGDLVWQIGTGKFGCRHPDGSFDAEAFRRTASHPRIRMIELKLSQGAKPGKGGILPKAKITPEIAKIRQVEPGQDVVSPPRHREWDDARGMCRFVEDLRKMCGKPVGVKFCLGDPAWLEEACLAFRETGILPDYLAVDGAEGGTGASPSVHSDLLGYPLLDALMMVEDALLRHGLREQIKLCASGKVWTGADLAVVLAAGADWAAAARGFMLSMGCVQALRCDTNTCPSGVTTLNRWLERGVVPDIKGPAAARYHREVLRTFADVLASCGHRSPDDLSRGDVMRVVGWHDIRPLSALVPYPPAPPTPTPTSSPERGEGGEDRG